MDKRFFSQTAFLSYLKKFGPQSNVVLEKIFKTGKVKGRKIFLSNYFFLLFLPNMRTNTKKHGDDKFYEWNKERYSLFGSWILTFFFHMVSCLRFFHLGLGLWWVGAGLFYDSILKEIHIRTLFLSIYFYRLFMTLLHIFWYLILKLNGNILKCKLIIMPARQF